MHPDMINPKEHRQLFLDDFAVESMKSTTRTLHSPKKWGPVINGAGVQSRSCPQWNSEKTSVGMVVLWMSICILRVLGRRRALGKTFPGAIRIERF